MNKLEGKIIAKFTMVLFIIMTMLFSNIMPIIAWAAENVDSNNVDDEYVKFNLTWNSDAITEEKIVNSSFNSSRIAYFKLDFNTIKTGFKNFKVIVESEEGVKVDLASVNKIGTGTPFQSAYGNTLVLNSNTRCRNCCYRKYKI